MTIEQTVAEKVRALPAEQQQAVLHFVESLEHERAARQPRRDVQGLWADLDFGVSDEDIAEVRREMWSNFPRDPVT